MIQARSIGKRAGEILRRPPIRGRVLASFARVCDLLTGDAARSGEVIALCWDGVKNGPFNILLDNQPGAALPAGTRFVVSGTRIRFVVDPPIEIELAGARAWDGRPDWRALIDRKERAAACARVVAEVLKAEAPAESLASLATQARPQEPGAGQTPAVDGRAERVKPDESGSTFAIRLIGFPVSGAEFIRQDLARVPSPRADWKSAPDTPDPSKRIDGSTARLLSEISPAPRPAAESAHLPVAARAIADLQTACARNDLPALGAAASRLCGLGPGLTPAGDDWLAGWLIGLRLRGDPCLDAIGEAIADAARERTTLLTQAFLACAAAGEVDENWKGLLSALASEFEVETVRATRSILAQGATSGADMLAGFLTSLVPENTRIYT